MKTEDRNDCDKDANHVSTRRVSCWRASGTLATAQMNKQTARDLVNNGAAFVINSGSIGMCD